MNRKDFVSYVESNRDALRRFLVALCCGDSQLADDLAQETLIKAWLSLSEFRGKSSFDTWIRSIAYRTFLNDRRAARTSRSDGSLADCAAISDDRADSAFRYQQLHLALAALSPKERSSILLYYLEGYSVKEIAEIENNTPEAVKQHLSRGRVRLRAIIENVN